MSVLLATGVSDLDNAIKNRLTSFQFVGSVSDKEELMNVISQIKPTHLLLSELLKGNLSIEELISMIYYRFPYLHIVFICENDNQLFDSFLRKHRIRDILRGNFSPYELEEKLQHPF